MKGARITGSNKKKARGRPPTARGTEAGTQVAVRWSDPELDALDGWRERQDVAPSRPEAIRRLVALALSSGRPRK